MTTYIDVVFAQAVDSPDLSLVEVENDEKFSISFGEWVKRDDGYLALRIKPEHISQFFKE